MFGIDYIHSAILACSDFRWSWLLFSHIHKTVGIHVQYQDVRLEILRDCVYDAGLPKHIYHERQLVHPFFECVGHSIINPTSLHELV